MGSDSEKDLEVPKGKIKVLSYGDNPKTSSGYGCVWDNLLTRWCKLKPDWEFMHLGWQSRDRPHKRVEGYTMLPVTGKLEYGWDTTLINLMKYKPQIFVTLCDVGYQHGYIKYVNEARKMGWQGKWLAYVPIDTHTWDYTAWDKIFEGPDVVIAMSKFVEEQMKEHGVKNLTMIPHGVDLETYHSIDREAARLKFKLQDKFVVGFVGRNQIRKMLDRLIKGYAQFAKDKQDVVLLLHTDHMPPGHGWILTTLIAKFENEVDPELVEKQKIILTRPLMNVVVRQEISTKEMNEIYNLMDVFCFATGGEGWGLPGIECQAAGTPLLMTDCTTAGELCRPNNKIPILKDKYHRNSVVIGANSVENVFPDDVELAKLLEKKYAEWKAGKLEKERKEARDFAQKYDWQPVAESWIKLFEEHI
jgi:glycosyltransferase involved in cell wall biosynthesis